MFHIFFFFGRIINSNVLISHLSIKGCPVDSSNDDDTSVGTDMVSASDLANNVY